MNVWGFSKRIRWKAISASASSPSNFAAKFAPAPLWASRSTTAKPTLWRVPSYLEPGLPRPTTSFLMAAGCCRPGGPGSLLLLVLVLALVLRLAADDFRLGGRRLGRGWLR